MKFDAPEYYENRELSWLRFNQRILNEARDKSAQRKALVNEKQRAGMSYFDAWQSAKAEKPELFND